MTWPDDGLPRFVVSCVEGYTINPATSRGPTTRTKELPVIAVVHDRAYAHRSVAQYVPSGHKGNRSADCLRKASAFAASLNDEDVADEAA